MKRQRLFLLDNSRVNSGLTRDFFSTTFIFAH